MQSQEAREELASVLEGLDDALRAHGLEPPVRSRETRSAFRSDVGRAPVHLCPSIPAVSS